MGVQPPQAGYGPLSQDGRGFPVGGAEPEEAGIDLRHYLAIADKYKWAVLGLGLVAAIAAWLIASTLTPIYQAKARLLIESDQAKVISIEEIYGMNSGGREYLQTQLELMRSRDIAERVAREENLTEVVEFNPVLQQPSGLTSWLPFLGDDTPRAQPSEERRLRTATGILMRLTTVEAVPNTRLVAITVDSEDPERAARLANAIGDTYIERGLEARLEMTQRAASWLDDRLDVLRKNLADSEQRLQDYREAEGLVDVGEGGVLNLTSSELDSLSSRLVEARQTRAQAQNMLDLFATTPREQWDSLGPVFENSFLQGLRSDLREQQRNVAELSQRYGPRHPKMITARENLDEARRTLESQLEKVVGTYQDQFDQANARVRDIQTQLEATRGDVQDIQRKEYQLQQLEREVETNRRLYDMFLTRFKETSQADFQDANARFVDRALAPGGAYKPRKMLWAGIAFALGLLIAAGIAFLREMLDNTLRGSGDLTERLQVPSLGTLPLDRAMARDTGILAPTLFAENQQGIFAESVRTVRTGVVLSGLDVPHKVIVVTSSVPGEGKTTVASSLALAMGQMEKVLLIDGDMRRPSLARSFELPRDTGGLAAIVAGEAEVRDCIHSVHGIDVLPAGRVPPNPLELLSSQRFKRLIKGLSEHYDRIIIDSAPCQAVSDAMVLASMADGLVFVIKSDATPFPVVQNSIKRLRGVNATILGGVLNRVDVEKKARYGYGGYSGYYDAYTYGTYGHYSSDKS
jgi:capsular exopolysaccharide synthesis family protein